MAVHSLIDWTGTLSAAFERDSRMDAHQYPVRISVVGSELILEGMQADIAAKRVAARLAREAVAQSRQTLTVVDRLRVAPAQAQEDGALRAEMISALTQEPVFRDYQLAVLRDEGPELLHDPGEKGAGKIEIMVEDGIVTLSGEVGSLTHRRLAEVLAWWTAGCQNVHNRLKVVPPEQETDGELADAIRMTLEKDPLVHADQISLRARAGVVTVTGYVASQQERRLAWLDIWCVPGVHEVDNQIRAGS